MDSTIARAAGPVTWQIDGSHTDVGFSVRHMMLATVKGYFSGVEGVLELNEADPTRSRVRVKLDAASVTTRNEQRDAHLRSPDFFDVEQYPQLTFESRGIERRADGRYTVTGDLTIRGVTREVVLDAEQEGTGVDPWGKERIGFAASGRVDRREFGLEWNQALEAGGVLVSDEVKIVIEGQAVRT
ncbi:MAG: YceI family protein [Gemmatimonadota bacterium]